jgi:elongation factor 1-alpha
MKDKEMINLIMLGRTDYGKSTLCGRVCVDLGYIPQEDILRIKKHAEALKQKGREYAFIMDESLVERQRGITIQLGFIGLEIGNKRVNLMDPPGHIEFINSLISGVAGADAGLLVIDAKEFLRIGLDPQIKEHLRIAKVFGIDQLIVLVNKMDLLEYSEKEYNIIVEKLVKILEDAGYKNAKKLVYIPISALEGENVTESSQKMSWYKGNSFIKEIEMIQEPERLISGPLRMPILRVYSLPDFGTVIAGRIEKGKIKVGEIITISPSFGEREMSARVKSIEWQHRQIDEARQGMDIGIALEEGSQNFTKRQVKKGYLITDSKNRIKSIKEFEAKALVLDHPTSIKKGYMPLLYCHQARIPCEIKEIKNSLKKEIKNGDEAILIIQPLKPFVAEIEKDTPKLGRFVLRDANRTVIAGEIINITYQE